MTLSELQAENERLKAEVTDVREQLEIEKKLMDATLKTTKLIEENEHRLADRLTVLKVERDALAVQCESLLGDVVKVADAEKERDEARAQAARLAEALQDAIALGKHLQRYPVKRTYHDDALASTDATQWLNEKIEEAIKKPRCSRCHGVHFVFKKSISQYDEDCVECIRCAFSVEEKFNKEDNQPFLDLLPLCTSTEKWLNEQKVEELEQLTNHRKKYYEEDEIHGDIVALFAVPLSRITARITELRKEGVCGPKRADI